MSVQSSSSAVALTQTTTITTAAQANKKFLVICYPSPGYGDFFGALKIANICKKHFSPEVEFALPEDWATQKKRVVTQELSKSFPLLTYKGVSQVDALTTYKPEVIVGYPCNGGNADPICESVCQKMNPPPVYLPLNEYGGFAPTGGFALGLGEKDLGIFIDPELVAAPKGLSQLSKLPPSLCQAILGTSYSEQAAADFDKDSKLYFGYSSDPKTRQWFIDTITQYNALSKEPRKLLFVVVGPGANSNKSSASNAKVLSFNFLEHPDMLTLLLASERESLGTGDISITDLFSADKIPLAEALDHKGYFTRDLMNLAEKQNSDFKYCLSDLFVNPFKHLDSDRAARALLEIKTNETLQKASNAFNAAVRLRDCTPKIIEAIQAKLKHESPKK